MSERIEILLVEDDPGDVHLAFAVFRALQMEKHCAAVHDGEQAMEFLLASGGFAHRAPGLPALVLLDLKMPRVGGFDVLQRMRANERLRMVPVVALSSSREDRDVQRAYELGANGYVVKGIDFDDYRETLKSVVRYWVSVNESPPQAEVLHADLLR